VTVLNANKVSDRFESKTPVRGKIQVGNTKNYGLMNIECQRGDKVCILINNAFTQAGLTVTPFSRLETA
jgi:hypothetical protein